MYFVSDVLPKSVRRVEIEGKEFYSVKDVCAFLRISNWFYALKTFCEPENTCLTQVPTKRGMQIARVVDADGVFDIMRLSNSPVSEIFMDWLCQDVLPTIRKTGQYHDPHKMQGIIDQMHNFDALKK